MKVLEGVRVLDMSIAMAGPFAAQKLGDLGAEVIKIEPVEGEWHRHKAGGGARGNAVNASFLSLNRNKRSLSVDLKSEEGRAVVHRLVVTADIFLQNYRPGVAERLGVDQQALRTIKPDLIYVSMSGYGETGPYATRPGQDLLLQAMSGALASGLRTGESPRPAPFYLADAFSAYSAVEGTLAAFLLRERTGEGQHVEVNMLDSLIAAQMQELTIATVGKVPQTTSDQIHAHSYIRAPYGVFPTADGYLAVSYSEMPVLADVFGDERFRRFDAERDGFTHRDDISALVSENLLSDTSAHWLEVLSAAGVWVGPVYDYTQMRADPQVRHNRSFVEYTHPTEGDVVTPGFAFRMSGQPQAVHRPAPLNGQHTEEILREIGLSTEQIDQLDASGVVHRDQTLGTETFSH
ncbi:CoA transferase [Mycolicibacterium neoaurum]|uniref:CaiB/BaiF CoA transferase family protein n=1 Tax=Mycolicibacterium neoaurum TaxID=1795 RepID=UPI00248B2C87|nr:CoA transferase [Mycolicibacterium neoaurum]MDO3401346.1 CoA transferase [Mycolicibacterium neoaurum]WBP93364.1 CoA transferase [Mycolicibacterium neoaurum]WBS06961.1 CoA transferase [Mycolicibacterium neoaurum]